MPETVTASESTKKTYRYLRLGISLLAVFLGAALVINMAWQGNGGCFDSISDYYYTSVHNAFVGTLVAMGLGLIAIQGRYLEDLLLDLAGIFAVIVALVPTPLDGSVTCAGKKVADVAPMVRNGVGAVEAVAAIALVVGWVVVLRQSNADGERGARLVGMAIATGLIAVFSMWFLGWALAGWHDGFLSGAHFISAALMFVLIGAVAVYNAVRIEGRPGNPRGMSRTHFKRWYYAVAVVMTAALLVGGVGALHPFVENWLLYVELALLVSFSAFWGLQTADYWEDGVLERQVRSASAGSGRSAAR